MNSRIILLLCILLLSAVTIKAVPTIEEVFVDPPQPSPLSAVKFIVGVNSNDSIDDVRLIVQEYRDDLCFASGFNISMNMTFSCCMEYYEVKIKLIHENATQIKYHLEILNNETWYDFETKFVSLVVNENDSANSTVSNSNDRSAPGFEVIIVISSIAIIIIFNMFRGKKLFSLFIVGILLIVSISGCIDDNNVNYTNNYIMVKGKDGYSSIQEAIDAASDGDTILVMNGTYYENIEINTSISLIGENRDTTIIDGSGTSDVVVISADSVTIRGFTIRGSGEEYHPNRDAGIEIRSKNNIISGNNISSNGNYGLYLSSNSNNNAIVNNTISENRYGIYSNYASINNISSNNISSNSDYGIYFGSHSDNNVIVDNIISDNDYGTRIKSSDNNRISRNLFINNQRGLYLCCGAGDNIIYYNIFKNNSMWNARDDVINQWDNGTKGNFWSDYTGIDINSDGVGDTPYNLFDVGNKKDRYPLMEEPFRI